MIATLSDRRDIYLTLVYYHGFLNVSSKADCFLFCKVYLTQNVKHAILQNVKCILHFRKDVVPLTNRISQLRKERRISQAELADAVEVTRQTIISLENGRYNASLLLAHKIARYFGLTIEEVFLFEEEESPC